MEGLNNTTAGEAAAAANQIVQIDSTQGNPTPEQVEAWKKEFGKVKMFDVDGCHIYFRQPTRQQVAIANDLLTKTKKADRYADFILKATQLNYITETANDDELYFALQQVVGEIITSKTANLKNG